MIQPVPLKSLYPVPTMMPASILLILSLLYSLKEASVPSMSALNSTYDLYIQVN